MTRCNCFYFKIFLFMNWYCPFLTHLMKNTCVVFDPHIKYLSSAFLISTDIGRSSHNFIMIQNLFTYGITYPIYLSSFLVVNKKHMLWFNFFFWKFGAYSFHLKSCIQKSSALHIRFLCFKSNWVEVSFLTFRI